MFGLTVVTAPTTEPVSIDEARRQCRIADSNDAFDLELLALITAARRYCETVTKKAFITQTLRLTRDAFPGECEGYEIHLPRPPLQSVTNIQYTDIDGATQTVAAASYVVDVTPEVGRIALAFGYEWPTDAIQQIAAVKVNYVAGYGVATAVPKTFKQAMLLLISYWFENKSAEAEAVPIAVNSLLGNEWTGSMVGAFG